MLVDAGLAVRRLTKVGDPGTSVIDLMEAGEIRLIINTPTGKRPRADENRIRRFALARGVPCITTMGRRARLGNRHRRRAGRGAAHLGAPGPEPHRAKAVRFR